MAKIKILGSCSGTEPMPGRHHTSLVLDAGDRNYFFDAGENCSHTAHVGGIDMLKTRAVFISHHHIDHIGGLHGIFWIIKKLMWVNGVKELDGDIKLFVPTMSIWEAVHGLLKASGELSSAVKIDAKEFGIGKVYEDENIKVTAFESHHMEKRDGVIQAYSFRIDVNGKKVVFSGDVKDMDDLVENVGDGCDILLCETGHHPVKTVCDFADNHNVGKLVFVHHGREILFEKPTAGEAIQQCRTPVVISEDGTELEI